MFFTESIICAQNFPRNFFLKSSIIEKQESSGGEKAVKNTVLQSRTTQIQASKVSVKTSQELKVLEEEDMIQIVYALLNENQE